MNILERPVAITDVETTGLDPATNEIIEIGLVVIDQQTLEIIDTLDIKIQPEHLETATEFALNLNGYNTSDWQNAVSLPVAMRLYAEKTRNAIFCSHNMTFDWGFISQAFKKTGVEDEMDYHRVDLFTMAWMRLRNSGLERFNMNEIAKYLKIPEEPMPHRAINGTLNAFKIYKRLIS